VLGPQGRRGEVLAELHTDFPQRFDERRTLSGWMADGTRRELRLEEHWFHKGAVVLKFGGVDSISDAEQLAGMEVQIPREQRAELEEGAAYVSELVGCEVWVGVEPEERLLGEIANVDLSGGAAPLLVVRNSQKREYLVPYAEEFLRSQDLAIGRIQMELPKGLLELQNPLSEEEKRRQKLEADEARRAGVKPTASHSSQKKA
jgi:16S rRNA processing protein RimM